MVFRPYRTEQDDILAGKVAEPHEWAQRIRERLEDGECFRAYDTAITALEHYPNDTDLRLLYTQSMLRTGALDNARNALTDWYREIFPDSPDSAPITPTVNDTVLKLGELFLECWQRANKTEDLLRARDLLLLTYRRDQSRHRAGITAATLSHLGGDLADAASLARDILQSPQLLGAQADFDIHFSRGLAHLLLKDVEQSRDAFLGAVAEAGDHYPTVVNARQELERYRRAGLDVGDVLREVLKPPALVLFAGTPIDLPGQLGIRFPPTLEDQVRQSIKDALDKLDARIGYSSAACGSDLLFCEAMLERQGEINLVLPFALEDFLRYRVRYAAKDWERRFLRVLDEAHSVNYATEERYLGHDILFRYANQILMGHAAMRASFLGSQPFLLAVWDLMLSGEEGTASDFIDHWPDILRLRLVDLDELRETLPAKAVTPGPATESPARSRLRHARAVLPRAIKAMLFADVVGYTRLAEEHLPGFHALLSELVERLDGRHTPLEKLESWGDAIFAVLPAAVSMAEYALLLQQTAADLDPGDFALPNPVQFRVGLHAGPVFQGRDPLTGRPNVYGHHVNQAARIEPVAAPGQVYASEQFVALLQAEENAARHAAESTGEIYQTRFEFDYLGILPLAKRYGTRPVYHLKLCPGVRL